MAALLQGPATRQDFDLYAARDYVLSIPTVNNEDGSPYVFESDTKVYWWLGLNKADPLVEKVSTDPAQITITGNTVSVRIQNADTPELKPSSSNRVYMHELEIIDPDGNKFTACVGTVTVFNVFDQNPTVVTGKLYSYDFLANPIMSPRLYLTRSTVGTYIDTLGTRITAAINAPRFENRWNGSSWVPAGLLVEDARSNYALTSDPVTVATNRGTDAATILASAVFGADNVNSMGSLQCQAGTGVHSFYIFPQPHLSGHTGKAFTSFDVKADNWNYIQILTSNAAGDRASAIINLSTATFTQIDNLTPFGPLATYARRLRNNIYRLVLVGGNPNPEYWNVGFAPAATGVTLDGTYGEAIWSSAAAGTEKVYVGGGTASIADYEMSHIPSVGGIATRGADVLIAIGTLPSELAAGPSVWEMTDLITGVTSRTSFAANTFTFPTKKLYRSFAVYSPGTDTSGFLTVGGPY